jgi:hypothetical protein
MGRGSIVAAAVSGMAVCAALCAGPGPAPARASAAVRPAASAAVPVWGTAQELPGIAAVNYGLADVAALSCSSPGNCAVGGSYADRAFQVQAFVADRRNGAWGKAIEVPGTAALNAGGNATVTSVSCTSAGECTAGGSYAPGGTAAGGVLTASEAFVATETGGAWGKAIEVPGTAALDAGHSAVVGSLSCWSPGNCTAAGSYAPGGSSGGYADTQAFAVTETAGTWGTATELPGLAALNAGGQAEVSSISCAGAGSCAVGGDIIIPGSASDAFVADESDGSWRPAEQVPGIPLSPGSVAAVNSVSCASPGNCSAAGYYGTSSELLGFVATEMNGTWRGAQLLAGTRNASSVSCASPGECVAGGDYDAGRQGLQAYLVTEANGDWGKPAPVPGLAAMNAGQYAVTQSVACSAPGDCGAGGVYADTGPESSQPFVVTETDGTWGHAQQVPGMATLNTDDEAFVEAISCTSPQACTAAGVSFTSAFVVSTGTQTAITASLSTATVIFGREQAEHVSVAVTAKIGGPPAGTVTVRAGPAVLCVITLASGHGSCTPTAAKFAPGTVKVAALFDGTPFLAPSAAVAKSFVTVKASSGTSFALSAARVIYGHEHSERLSVTVLPQYAGIPAGKVTIKAGAATLCVITLHSAKGACRLAASELRPGIHRLTAAYRGNADFTPSRSHAETLSVMARLVSSSLEACPVATAVAVTPLGRATCTGPVSSVLPGRDRARRRRISRSVKAPEGN